MPEHDLLKIFIEPIDDLKIPYIVTGAVASIIYGEPRLTHDIDLVLELKKKDVERLLSKFPSDLFYTPPPEVITTEITRSKRGHFNIIHHETGFRADIYLVGNDSFQKWAIDNYKSMTIGNKSYRIAPAEYVIILKLEYYREGQSDKHLRDIRAILKISPEEIDRGLLERFIKDHSLELEWNKIPK
jgi:hypothetical protein